MTKNALIFKCPNCGQLLEFSPKQNKKIGLCHNCNAEIEAPSLDDFIEKKASSNKKPLNLLYLIPILLTLLIGIGLYYSSKNFNTNKTKVSPIETLEIEEIRTALPLNENPNVGNQE